MRALESSLQGFEYVKPAPLNTVLNLLTVQGKVEVGPWKGPVIGSNGTYLAWAPVPGRDRELERLARRDLEQR
jgi:hypothetical protein